MAGKIAEEHMQANRSHLLIIPVFLLLFSLVLPNMVAQTIIATVPVGSNPSYAAVNPVTNRVYVANENDGTVSVIDGSTNTVIATPSVGLSPYDVAVNPATNQIYVTFSDNVAVIDGATNNVTSISVPNARFLAVNSATNKIYVSGGGTVTVIDGASQGVTPITVGGSTAGIAVNALANKVYVAITTNNTVAVIDGATDNTSTVNVGRSPTNVGVNSATSRVYVSNFADNTVTVIDGANNNQTTTVDIGLPSYDVEVNSATNKIYVANNNTVTVIDGASNGTTTVKTGSLPFIMGINSTTNKVYVPNGGGTTATVIDGSNNSTINLTVGVKPFAAAVNPSTNRVYITNTCGNDIACQSGGTVTVIDGTPAPPLRFVAVTPCRAFDTRKTTPIQGGTSRDFIIAGTCGIPPTAAAYSLNIGVVPQGPLGFLTAWPTGGDRPLVSTLNSTDGRIKANAAIVPAGAGEAVSVYVTDTTNVFLDVNGYFVADSSQLAFYPLTPCRVVDTRRGNGGIMQAGETRDFPLLAGPCNIPSTAQAYSLNFTVVPPGRLGYLSTWPAGQTQPLVSTLNDTTGTIVANAAIVPAGTGGDIDVYVQDATQVVIDINGYFAPPDTGGLSLYTVAPCRVLDTRKTTGAFNGLLVPPVNVVASPCGVLSTAQGFVLNATVVPPGPLGYLTLWPDGEQQPVVSTLNAFDGYITNNMAIVPTVNGSIDAFANGTTQLILDLFGYFAP